VKVAVRPVPTIVKGARARANLRVVARAEAVRGEASGRVRRNAERISRPASARPAPISHSSRAISSAHKTSRVSRHLNRLRASAPDGAVVVVAVPAAADRVRKVRRRRLSRRNRQVAARLSPNASAWHGHPSNPETVLPVSRVLPRTRPRLQLVEMALPARAVAVAASAAVSVAVVAAGGAGAGKAVVREPLHKS